MDPVPNSHFDYLRWRWRLLPARTRRFWKWVGGFFLLLWLAGAFVATRSVAALGNMDPIPRLVCALAIGPAGIPLWWLEAQQVFADSARQPAPWWVFGAAANGGLGYLVHAMLTQPAGTEALVTFHQYQHRLVEGRLEETEEILGRVSTAPGIPLAEVGDPETAQTVSLPFFGGQGHVLVVGPSRSGKGLHLTQTLLTWPGPVVCIDPRGEQYRRTAGTRARIGPIYTIPGYSVRLADYYDDLADGDALAELHLHLLKPWQSRDPIFANKSKSLFAAVGAYAAARGLDPMRVLLDAAASDPVSVLQALEQVARREVRQFTNGLDALAFAHDRFATSAYGTFTTQLSDYQKHVATIAPTPDHPVIPSFWPQSDATVYITYSLNDLKGVSGVVAAILAAFMRRQNLLSRGERLLMAIDEVPAVELGNLNLYLSTVGGAGVTILLYAQNVSQLRTLYGKDGAEVLSSHCKHQVWYPPATPTSSEVVSEMYGTTLVPTQTRTTSHVLGQAQPRLQRGVSEGLRQQPALSPAAVRSLPKEQVVVQTEADRIYCFLGRRLNPIPRFADLPPPPAPMDTPPAAGERVYVDWEAVEAEAAAGRALPAPATNGAGPGSERAGGPAPAETAAPDGAEQADPPAAEAVPPAATGDGAPAEAAPEPVADDTEEVAPDPEDRPEDDPAAAPIDLTNFFGK